MAAAVPGPRYSGWWSPPAAASGGAGRPVTLEFYVNGVKVGTASSALLAITGGITTTTSLGSTTTITAGTGLVVTAGDAAITAGNLRLGAISAFATTEPTSAVVMKVGTNPVGAITTSGGIFVTTGGATISKIIAAGTVSQIEA